MFFSLKKTSFSGYSNRDCSLKNIGRLTAKMAETALTWKQHSAHLLPITAVNLCIASGECLFLSHMSLFESHDFLRTLKEWMNCKNMPLVNWADCSHIERDLQGITYILKDICPL